MASLRRVLSDDLYGEVSEFADQSGMTVTQTMRRALRLGLAILRIQKSGQTLLLRQDGAEKEIMILD